MPLPSHDLEAHGGCGCGAIRYKVSIPKLSERPLHPSSTDSNKVPLPMAVIDHCNDCRRAVGSALQLWMCTPTAMVTTSVVLRSTASLATDPTDRKDAPEEKRSPWVPALEVFTPDAATSDSFLSCYSSSKDRYRFFCGRCGTYMAYIVTPMPTGWPDMLDLPLGTMDRKDLENDAFKPERQLWWDCGIDWIGQLASHGTGPIPKHPSYRIDEFVEE